MARRQDISSGYLVQWSDSYQNDGKPYIAAHEAILRILQAVEQQTITEAQAIGRLEEAAALLHEPGVAATYRQTIERLRQRRESRG